MEHARRGGVEGSQDPRGVRGGLGSGAQAWLGASRGAGTWVGHEGEDGTEDGAAQVGGATWEGASLGLLLVIITVCVCFALYGLCAACSSKAYGCCDARCQLPL